MNQMRSCRSLCAYYGNFIADPLDLLWSCAKPWMIVNSFWPNVTMWQDKSGSTLALAMVCCLMASSHYLNQYWLIINKVLWHSPANNFLKVVLMRLHFHSSPPGQNGCHFTDDTFRCIFVNEKFCILIKISKKFVPKGPIDNIPALV